MAQLTALHKTIKTVDYFTTAVQPDWNRLLHNPAADVHGTNLGHIPHSSKRYCTLKKGGATHILKFTEFPNVFQLPQETLLRTWYFENKNSKAGIVLIKVGQCSLNLNDKPKVTVIKPTRRMCTAPPASSKKKKPLTVVYRRLAPASSTIPDNSAVAEKILTATSVKATVTSSLLFNAEIQVNASKELCRVHQNCRHENNDKNCNHVQPSEKTQG